MTDSQQDLFGGPLAAPGPTPPAELIRLEGVVDRVLHANAENGFTVARLEVAEGSPVTVLGTLPGIQCGERIQCLGRWQRDRRFGEQFRVESWNSVAPSTLQGIERYLASGLVKGVGPTLAARLVAHFGLDTLDVIETQPERLAEVPGVGARRVADIRAAWRTGREARAVMVFLQGHGVSPAYAGRIVRRYGQQALSVVKANPYRLAEDVEGIGFVTADRIAQALGVAPDSPLRLRAWLLNRLLDAAGDGHTCLPRGPMVARSARDLGLPAEAIDQALDGLLHERRIVESPLERSPDTRGVALLDLDTSERDAALHLRRLLDSNPPAPATSGVGWLPWAERTLGITLAEGQRDAVMLALRSAVAVVTGGPGTGKTTLLRVLTAVLAQEGASVELGAPTGRAAQRLSEATGLPARTLHRLLDFNPADQTFRRNATRPLKADHVVVDEASMLDQHLLAAVLDALPGGTRLLLVGDVDQLPSVGPGRVLADLIESGVVPVVRLERVYRQSESSTIPWNAHRIRDGVAPEADEHRPGDIGEFFIIPRDDPEQVAQTVVELVSRRIPQGFGLDALRDIQVLAPMHRGRAGAQALNQQLQAALNPKAEGRREITRGARIYREGDRVMQVRNDYDREVWNGDLGVIDAADLDRGELRVRYDDRVVAYGWEDLDALQPAYAITVHKSQGSEYPAVVVPLVTEHYVMLRRNLLYTAVTRARRLVVLVGSAKALRVALRVDPDQERFTHLRDRLLDAVGGPTG